MIRTTSRRSWCSTASRMRGTRSTPTPAGSSPRKTSGPTGTSPFLPESCRPPLAVTLGVAGSQPASGRWLGRPMNFYVGTSGYAYKEWKGSFYPDDLPAKQMLRYYGERFRSVEVNYTFTRMPTAALLEGWARLVPTG